MLSVFLEQTLNKDWDLLMFSSTSNRLSAWSDESRGNALIFRTREDELNTVDDRFYFEEDQESFQTFKAGK